MRRSRSYAHLAATSLAVLLITPGTAWSGMAGGTSAEGDIGIAAAPALELPFTCGTVWKGDSASSSAPGHQYAIDWNKYPLDVNDRGQPILAAAAGTIGATGTASSNYGIYVEINHGSGHSTFYAHLDTEIVSVGQTVAEGQKIGTLGNTDGNNPGISPHLHFEYRDYNYSGSWPTYIRPATFHGDPFDYATGVENYTSSNCGRTQHGGVAVTSRGAPGLDLFVTESDGGIQHRNWNGSTWSYGTLGGVSIADPAAVATGSGRLDVFVLGSNRRLYVNTWLSGQTWTGWRQLSTIEFSSSPAVAKRYSSGIDIAIRGLNSDMYHGYYNLSTGAVSFSNLGGDLTSAPAILASEAGDRLTVFARGPNGNLWFRMWSVYNEPDGWYSWVDRNQPIFGKPSVTSRGDYKVDMFYQSTSTTSMMHWYSPNGVDWTTYDPVSLGGPVYGPPGAYATGAGRLDVFSRASDGDLLQKWWLSGSPWSGWANRGAIP